MSMDKGHLSCRKIGTFSVSEDKGHFVSEDKGDLVCQEIRDMLCVRR